MLLRASTTSLHHYILKPSLKTGNAIQGSQETLLLLFNGKARIILQSSAPTKLVLSYLQNIHFRKAHRHCISHLYTPTTHKLVDKGNDDKEQLLLSRRVHIEQIIVQMAPHHNIGMHYRIYFYL